MKYLLIALLLFPSCVSMPIERKRGYIPKHRRILSCVKELLKMDVKPDEALKICQEIHK